MEPVVKYYWKGAVKTVNGRVYEWSGNKWHYDFYHDWDDVITPENECTLEEALKYKAYVPREKYLSNELHG